jgi:transposase-like protein
VKLLVADANCLPAEPRMNMHKNARLTPQGRLLMVRRILEEGWTVEAAAAAAGLSVRRTYHWLERYRAGGERMLHDRILAPARYPDAVPPERIAEIERRRRQRMSGPAIARAISMPRSTVGAILPPARPRPPQRARQAAAGGAL